MGGVKKGSVVVGNAIAVITPAVKVHVVVWKGTFAEPAIIIVGGDVKPVPPFVIVNPVIIFAAVLAVIFIILLH